MDVLLALIELFLLRVTVEVLRANIGSKSAISLQPGPVEPKFQVEGVAAINHFLIFRWLGVVVSIVGRINEVNQHRTRLVHDG